MPTADVSAYAVQVMRVAASVQGIATVVADAIIVGKEIVTHRVSGSTSASSSVSASVAAKLSLSGAIAGKSWVSFASSDGLGGSHITIGRWEFMFDFVSEIKSKDVVVSSVPVELTAGWHGTRSQLIIYGPPSGTIYVASNSTEATDKGMPIPAGGSVRFNVKPGHMKLWAVSDDGSPKAVRVVEAR